MSLESVDDIERSDSLTLGVLGVSDRVTDDILKAGISDVRVRGKSNRVGDEARYRELMGRGSVRVG